MILCRICAAVRRLVGIKNQRKTLRVRDTLTPAERTEMLDRIRADAKKPKGEAR